MATTTKREHAFNVLLSAEEMSSLQRIADEWGQSKGAALRKMLKSARIMVIEESPMCASGIRCFVPHMHPTTPPPAITPRARNDHYPNEPANVSDTSGA